MIAEWAYFAAFGLICAALMWIAFRPAWREWRSPTDSRPLPVLLNYTGDIDHFAEKFRLSAVARISGKGMTADAAFDVVPAEPASMDWSGAQRPLISFGAIKATSAIRCRQPLFVNGSIESLAGGSFSALFSQGGIRLGPQSEILDWAYADDVIHLGAGCTAWRRISSATAVELDDQCCFERINAPVVRFALGQAGGRRRLEPALTEASLGDLKGATCRTGTLYVVRGDCAIPPMRHYRGSLIVTGRLTIGDSTRIDGDVKARKGVSVGPRARVGGALTSGRKIEVLEGAFILGPVISESVIKLGADAVIGKADIPTTVSAENIFAEAGAVAHGTVWARELGMVWSA